MEMLNSGKLAKQRVCALDKYIHKHNLLAVKAKNKPQKVNAIISITYGRLPKAPNKQAKLLQCGKGMRHYPFVLVIKTCIGGNRRVE